ncbi:MAG: response regulator [Anaerolineae bacterium]|nr:MAG: response regulator [Anaerolineae bacterium]
MPDPLAIIVEDDPFQAEIFSQALQQARYQAIICADGGQGLEQIRAHKPWLVVLDLQLPGLNGEQILDAIRADEQLAQTQVIVATANPQMAATLYESSDLVLIKPISFSQLRQLAERLYPDSHA